jgi:DNA-binding NarL/FixJ family response regulator
MDTAGDALRVVLADDHHFFREGLRGMLEADGMDVIGEAVSGEEAVALARALAPDVLVIDLNMPGSSGLEALLQMAEAGMAIQTVVLTVSDEDADVVAALAAGACGYLLKDTSVDQLAGSIRQAAEGHMVLSRDVARALMAHVRASFAPAAAGEDDAGRDGIEEGPGLTPREIEVLRLMAAGAENAAIGLELSISPHTVKQYVTNIFEKLGVRSRVQAAVYAVRAGIV